MLTATLVHLIDQWGAPVVAGFTVLFTCCLLNHPPLRPITFLWGAARRTTTGRRRHRP